MIPKAPRVPDLEPLLQPMAGVHKSSPAYREWNATRETIRVGRKEAT